MSMSLLWPLIWIQLVLRSPTCGLLSVEVWSVSSIQQSTVISARPLESAFYPPLLSRIQSCTQRWTGFSEHCSPRLANMWVWTIRFQPVSMFFVPHHWLYHYILTLSCSNLSNLFLWRLPTMFLTLLLTLSPDASMEEQVFCGQGM